MSGKSDSPLHSLPTLFPTLFPPSSLSQSETPILIPTIPPTRTPTTTNSLHTTHSPFPSPKMTSPHDHRNLLHTTLLLLGFSLPPDLLHSSNLTFDKDTFSRHSAHNVKCMELVVRFLFGKLDEGMAKEVCSFLEFCLL